jgi:hypothetical protein
MIPKAKELKFNSIGENFPDLNCNMCGRKIDEGGRISQDIPIPFADDAHVSIVVCSKYCEKTFKEHAGADTYIRALVDRSQKLHFR